MPLFMVAGETEEERKLVFFHVVDDDDGKTPLTDQAGGQPQISINGSAFSDTGIGTLVAIGNGRYYAVLSDDTISVAGRVIESRYKSAASAESIGTTVQVVSIYFGTLGSYSLTVVVQDEDSNPLTAEVQLWTSEGERVSQGTTDANGEVVFKVSNGTWTLYIGASGYEISNPYTQVISGAAETKTITLSEMSATIPTDPTVCTVYGYLYNTDGTAIANAKVKARIIDIPAYNTGKGFTKDTVVAYTQSNGKFELGLLRSSEIVRSTDVDGVWEISIDEIGYRKKVIVPDEDTALFTTLEEAD